MDYVRGTLLILILASSIVRFIPLTRNRWVGIDSFYNLTIARDIRNRTKEPPGDEHFIMKSGYSHPPLLHWLLSLCPPKYYRQLQFAGPLVDVGCIVLVWSIASITLGEHSALLITAIYATYPILVDAAFTITSRVVGNLLLVMIIGARVLRNYGIDSTQVFIVCTALAILLILCHRLSFQILLVIAAADILTFHSPVLLVASIAATVLLVLHPRSRRVLRGHIEFIRTMIYVARNRQYAQFVSGKSPRPDRFLFNSPVLLVFIILGFAGYSGLDSIGLWSLWISLSILTVSVLWPLGEGYRHIMGGALPAAIGMAQYQTGAEADVWILVSIVLLQFAFQVAKIIRVQGPRSKNIAKPDLIRVLKWIDSSRLTSPKRVLLIIPLEYSYDATYFCDSATVVHGSGGEAQGLLFNLCLRHELQQGLNSALDKHGVNLLLIDKGDFGAGVPSSLRPIYESGSFACFAQRDSVGDE